MSAPAAGGDAARQLVLEHLRNRAIVPPGAEPAAGPGGGTALALGVPGIELSTDGELTAFGHRCQSRERRLADLLSAGAGGGLYFADRPALEAAHGAGYDPVLYRAFRDFLPPRNLGDGRHELAGTPGYDSARAGCMLADLIVYEAGTLPGGELFRSTGHWNLPWQLEIFQTLTGRVLMLVGGHDRQGRRFLYTQASGPGEVIAVPFGAWHVSYVLDGPAVVFNVTADLAAQAGQRDAGAAGPGPGKYHRGGPIAVTACQHAADFSVVGAPEAHGWGPPSAPPDASWTRPFLAGGSLADLHLHGPVALLEELRRAALRAHLAGAG